MVNHHAAHFDGLAVVQIWCFVGEQDSHALLQFAITVYFQRTWFEGARHVFVPGHTRLQHKLDKLNNFCQSVQNKATRRQKRRQEVGDN